VSQADEIEKLGLDPQEHADLAGGEAERWLEALRAAARPDALTPAEHERLLELALEDPFAPPSEEELIESARLREALANDDTAHADAALLAALRAPFAQEDGQAAARPLPESARQAEPQQPRRNVIYATFGGAGVVLAAAAALALTFGTVSRESAPSASAPRPNLVKPRSTAPMFAGHFDSNTTARMDMIASARERDLRDNRYTAWGVR
jgi:hypothetical protein